MANTLRIKRRTSGAPGAPTSLDNAELAYNEVDDVLYYGKGTGGAGGTATTTPAIAGSGAFLTLSSAQTVSGNKTFTGSVDLTGATATASTQLTADNSTKVATTAFVKAQLYITGNQNITFTGDATGSGSTSVTLTLANSGVTAGTYTKVTVDAKGRATSGTTLSATDIPTLTAAKISDFDTQVRTSRLDQMAAPTAAVSANSQKITNLALCTADSDAANKGYVDSVAQGLDVKSSVRVATTASITLSATQTIDGISVIAGDRVLVKNQSTASQNGIYIVAAGAWTRSTDMDAWAEFISAFTFVEQGTVNGDTGWVCTADPGGTLGSTSVAFAQFSGAGTYLAGNGLGLTGNTFSVSGTSNRISVSGSGVDIAPTYVGQTSITTLGTITTGTWNGSTLTVAYGGTGATTLTGILKGNGTSAFTAAVDGTDYLSPNATIDGGTF
jgi:hypothetical protein